MIFDWKNKICFFLSIEHNGVMLLDMYSAQS